MYLFGSDKVEKKPKICYNNIYYAKEILMKKFYKVFNIVLVVVFLFFITSCNTPNTDVVNELTIISVNDFHGALTGSDGNYGIARLAGAINQERNQAKATVLVSAGDMFQGTALSSYDHGKTVIEIMNKMNFDAMVLGNHEYDWGYEEIYKYVDGDQSNGEANFPYLGCNIIEKATNTLPKGVDAYKLIERGGLKIGIVGFMGENNESDISYGMIEPYQFDSPLTYISNAVKELRTKKKADIVIVVGHEDESVNDAVSRLTGDEHVDAIINAHSHYTYQGTISRNGYAPLPYLQAGSAGEKYGVIKLKINQDDKTVTSVTSTVKNNNGKAEDSTVKTMVEALEEETKPVFQRVIGKATMNVNRYGGADWAANALKEYTGMDIAVINIGGIRSQAFPINVGQDITVAKIHEIMPFDNIVKTVDLTGNQVRRLVAKSDFVLSANVYTDNEGNIYINGEALSDTKTYSVASIDYIFDKPSNPFLSGKNIVNTNILFRDVLIATVENDGTIIIPERSKNGQ